MRWRIYYADGSTWEDDPWKAPACGVEVIKQAHDNERGFILIHGKDTYCWFGDDFGWQGTDQPGFYDYLMGAPGPKRVIFGRTVHDHVYQALCRRAAEEPL